MGKVWRPRRRPAEAPLEVDGVKDRPQGVGVAVPVGKIMRQPQPRRPAKAPLKSVGVKEDAKRVVASSVGAGGSGVAGSLEEDGTAAVVCLMEEDSLDDRTAVGKVWRPRPQPQRPAKAPLNAVGVKYAQGAVAMASSMLEAPVVAAARGHWDKGPLLLEDHGTAAAVCRMDSLDGAPVVIAMTQRHKSVGAVLKKDTKEVALGKVWRPRKPAKKAPLKAVGVKDTKGVDVIGVDDGEVIKASGLGASMVAAEKWPLEDGIAMCRIDTLGGATRQKAAVGLMKDARGGVVVGKMWQPRRPPVKAPMKAVGVNDTQGVAVITVDGVVEAAKVVEKGPLEDEIAMCLMDSLDQAPVIATTRHEAVEVKNTKGVAVGKMWRPRRPAKDLVQVVGVKDDEGVVVTDVDRKVEASVLLGAPVLMGREKVPLEEGIALCQVDALDGAPVISTTLKEEVAVNNAEGGAVGKRRRPRRSAKKPLEALGVKDAEGVAVITLVGKVEPLVLGVPMVAEVGDREKGPLEDGIVVCPVDALNGAPVIATDEKEEVSVQGDPVVLAAGGREKGSLEDGIVVCRVDALDRAPVISTTREEEVGVKSDEGVVVGKRRRPRRSVKKPLEALGVNDAEGVAVNTLTGEVEPLVLGVLVVTEVGGREKGQLEDGIVVCPVDALNAAPVMATDEKEEVWVQGDPVVAEARGGEKGSLEDGIVVCRVDTLKGDPFNATDEKEEVSVQGNPVFPTVDQKVDAPVLERIQTITVKGNGKEDKDKEGIKWLKHYSTAQSILIIGDGDFSFSLALATAFGSGGNLVATSLDTYGALTSKYGKAESNVRELKRLGATVLHGVDAETMKLHPYLEMRRFDRIVFNFPHAGFKGKEYQLHVISSHKQLVRGFLANARQLLRPSGEIHLSHKKGFPYDAWGIKKLACESCLIMVRKVDFSKEDYPGYNQKRGDGVTCDDSFPLGPCWTFMFRVGDVEKLKKAHGNRVGLISSCLGKPGKCYPPSISAASMMWPFDLHPTWPQPHFPPVHMPIAFDPCPFGLAGLEDPFNCYGTSFHHQHIVQPTHQEQPWYQEGPPIGTPWTPQEHQSLQKEYEIHRQLTRSLEDRYMESVERQATLEMLIQVYGRH